jgi:hypothetical protein
MVNFLITLCIIWAILSALGIWVPNRFGITMLWLMVAWNVALAFKF